jgi:hypothetical protein
MAFKDWFAVRASLAMKALPGMVRVEIRVRQTGVAMLSEILAFGWLFWITSRGWEGSLLHRLLSGWELLAAAAALFYFLTRSEVIEFDRENLTIRRNLLGWQRTSKYPVGDCSELTRRTQEESGDFALECNVGWRKIKFARHATEEQAGEVLTLLQRELPEVAQKMSRMPDGVPSGSH